MKSVAILGASGYTGAELIRLLAGHNGFEIKAMSADRKAGQAMASVYPHLRHLNLPLTPLKPTSAAHNTMHVAVRVL